jgi:RNA polymerase sigma-70 factor (ECF subfamily)
LGAVSTDELRVNEPEDEELMARAQQGDSTAFDELVRRHFQVVHTYAMKIVRDRERALDVTQDAFVRAFRHRASYRPSSGTVRGWLMAIAANRARDSRREALRRRQHESERMDMLEDLPTPGDNGLDAFARGYRRETILAEIEKLPREYREVLTLKYLCDLSYEEIAKALEVSMGAVWMRASRARDILARRLARLVE